MGIKIDKPDMTPIRTTYNGYTFRSRLEARWAMMLDAQGQPWRYEDEGYNLDGYNYLPDFFLPERDCFFEVKPKEDAFLKPAMLSMMTGKRVIVTCTGPIESEVILFTPQLSEDGRGVWRQPWRLLLCRDCRFFLFRDKNDSREFCTNCGASCAWQRDEAERIARHSFWDPAAPAKPVVVPPPVQVVPTVKPSIPCPFAVGDRVVHDIGGEATVTDCWTTKNGAWQVDVAFDGGGGTFAYADDLTAISPTPIQPPFALASLVEHPLFGTGIVTECRGLGKRWTVTVDFERVGTKRLDAELASLTVVAA